MRRSLRRVIAVLAALTAVLGAVLVAVWAFGPTTAADLTYSLSREAGGLPLLSGEPCRRDKGVWVCFVDDGEGSGNGADYELRMTEGRCWTARRIRRYPGVYTLKARAAGCVTASDRLRLLNRL